MRIAVSAAGGSTRAPVAHRFGRAPYFVVVDTADGSVGVVANPTFVAAETGGAQAASLLGLRGASVVLTGSVAPVARVALQAQGIAVVEGASGTVKEALDRFVRTH